MTTFQLLFALRESHSRKVSEYEELKNIKEEDLLHRELEQSLNNVIVSKIKLEAAESEILSDPAVDIPYQRLVHVYYESGYKWSVHLEDASDMIASGLRKSDAISIAKDVVKEVRGRLKIDKLPRNWRSMIMLDRWEEALGRGENEIGVY